MAITKEILEGIFQKRSKEDGIETVLSVVTEPAVGKGECYSSEIVRLKMEVVYGSGRTGTRSVLYKKLPDNEALRAFLTEYNCFPAEIDTFRVIIPALDELMTERGDTNDRLWCDCLWFNPYDQLILQDLKELGYRTLARQARMDVDHAVLTLNSLGRLHAMSAVLIHEKRVNTAILKPYPMGRDDPSMSHLMSVGLATLAEVIKDSWGSEWEKAAEIVMSLSVGIGPRIKQMCANPGDNLIVYNHGDCWVNNIMFKYGTWTDKPIGLRFIDYQECHFNSFGWDLSMFFHTSMSPQVVRENYDALLEAYRSSLLRTFEFYRYVPDNAPSLDVIKAELDRLLPYGLALSAHFLPVLLADAGESMDGNYVLTEGDDSADRQKKKLYTAPKYTEIIKDIVANYISRHKP